MEAAQNSPGWRTRLSQFFYAEEVPYNLALVRICFPLALLYPALPRWFHARELYSLDGAPTPLWENYGYFDLLPIPGAGLAVTLATLYIVSLLTLSCGWQTRMSAAIATVLTAYLGLLDAVSTMTKYTCVATHVLLLLSISNCGSLWSVDAWLRRRRTSWPGEVDSGYQRVAMWPRRLLQIFMAVVYFAAAITKLQTPSFFSGEQMYFWLLADVNYANPLGEYATLWPPILIVMGLTTIVWEIVFPFLCWRGLPKAAVLVFGVVFHLLTVVMLGLYAFPLICLSVYWAYFDAEDVRNLAWWLRRKGRAWRGVSALLGRVAGWAPSRPAWATASLSASGFALVCAIVVGVALEAERRVDVYGRARPAGRFALQPLDPDVAERMVSGMERVRYEDHLHAFEVGSRLLGGWLANRQSEFQYGERALVECCITPPHGDLYVECNLHDDQGRILQRSGQVMVRDKMRTHFDFLWTQAYPAGEYDLVLSLDGQEVSKRRVRVGLSTPSGHASTATAMAR